MLISLLDLDFLLEVKDASDISYATKLNLPGKSHLRQYFISYVSATPGSS